MPKLTQNFNISPYYDDFDASNDFFKVLFRPGYSVQARELTQLQSILQNQLEHLGDTLYKDGSKVIGANISLNTTVNSLKLKTNYSDNLVTTSNFVGRIIEGQTSGARAEVVASEQFTNLTLNTIMINYVNDVTFVDDEIINTVDSGVTYFANVAGANEGLLNTTTLVTSVASGPGSVVSVEEGIFYIGGFFCKVSNQTIILEKYLNNPTFRIGLEISETISTSVDDASLLDNAIGSPNYTAPGANRYKVSLNLVKKDFYRSGESIVTSGLTFSVNTKDNKSGTVNITTATDHNLRVGDVIVVNGANETEYNGKHTVSSVGSTTTFSYNIQGKPATPATGSFSYIRGVLDPIEQSSTENFIELLRVENGEKTEEANYSNLGTLEKTLARRTFDQSGDFTVRPFSLDMVNHKIQGIAGDRTVGNTDTTVTANGSNFIADVNVGDVIFFSGNTSKTATVDSISNTTLITLSTGTSLGDGSTNQKIGIDSKVTAALGPGKAYVKGYEYESVSTSFIDVNKGRDTRSVTSEKQGVEFGPFLRVTDFFSSIQPDTSATANIHIDIGANTANGQAQGSGMQLVDLHMVKWPSTTRTDGTANLISGDTPPTTAVQHRFVGIDFGSSDDIANTKIGTARVRQLDYHTSRNDSINSIYATDASSRTMHRIFPTIYDAHVYDMRFDKITGSASASDANTSRIQLKTSGAGHCPTVNCLFGCTVTVNTSFLGVTTSDTRKIVGWTGSQTSMSNAPATAYTAELDSPLSQETRSNYTTYSIDFGVKDIQSLVLTDSTYIYTGMNIDVSGKLGENETNDTILFDNSDEQRSLIFPLNSNAISQTSNLKYKTKRMFRGVLTSSNTVSISAPSGESFMSDASDGSAMTPLFADQNYIVVISKNPGTISTANNGHVLEFSNTSGSGLGKASGASTGRSITVSNSGQTLDIDVGTTVDTGIISNTIKNANYAYQSSNVVVYATMNVHTGTLGTTLGKKTLVSGNTTIAVIQSDASNPSANLTQANAGQISLTGSINLTPGEPTSLKLSDVKKLVAIVDSGALSSNVSNTMVEAAVISAQGGTSSQYDITSRFSFDTGQRDNFYDYATITLKPGQDKPTGQVIAIVDHYTHTGYGPFTVDSYIHSDSGNTPYTEIPTFISPTTGVRHDLRDVIDFRPKRIGYETANTLNGTDSYTNDITSTSNVFSAKALPNYDYVYETDYSHYLPRKDKLVLGRDRKFRVLEGVADINPLLPPDDEDSMTLYTMEIPAYTFNPSDINLRYIDNRRYTMRDIGKLERRIETLEYYTSLSLLEKEADGLVVTDTNQNDRFKNGILVDPFAGHNIGDVTNDDYVVSIDFDKKELRPSFSSDNFNFDFDSDNSTLVNNSGIITLPFASNTFISSPLTGSLSGKNVKNTIKINPFSIKNYMGQLSLDPKSDNWYDQTNRVDVKVNIEGQYDNWPNVVTNNAHGSHYNDWEEIWSGIQVNNDVREGIRDLGDVSSNIRRAKTTNQQKTLSGIKSGNVPEKIIKVFGNKLVNISIVPKVRQQTIKFIAKGLKPSKNVYAFFNDVPVSTKITQASRIILSNVSSSNVFQTTSGNFETIEIVGSGSNAGNTATVIYMNDRNAQNGCSILVTNLSTTSAFTQGSVVRGLTSKANGTITSITNFNKTDSSLSVLSDGVTGGVFDIDAGLYSGTENLLRLTDDPNNISKTSTSVAEAIFHSKGALDTKNENGIISTRPIIARREDLTEERVTRVTTDGRLSKSTKWLNPLAQTFFIDKDQYPNGLFLDNVTLFFENKDTSTGIKSPVTVQIRPVISGLPSSSTIIPGSEVVLTPGRVTANTSVPSSNSSGGFPDTTLGNSFTANKSNQDVGSKTIFNFEHPIYLTPDEYAIVVMTNSSEYSLYAYDLGALHTNSDRKITKQPYIGSFFKPLNSGSWLPEVDKGIMFQLNRCEFTSANGYVRLDNKNKSHSNATSNVTMDSIKLNADTLEFSNTISRFFYFETNLNDSTKQSTSTKFNVNKNVSFKKQKYIDYDSVNNVMNNKFTLNVYFETANTLLSPVIDLDRMGLITINNIVNNGSISNDDIIVTANGTGYDTDITDNTSVFVVSAPDIGSNTATLKANLVQGTSQINKVITVNPGSGYFTTPTISVSDGGTSGLSTDSVAGSGAIVKIIGEGANGSNMLTANVSHSSGGNMQARYITRRVTLEEGFDARDLRVYLNAYKPRGSNIHVYFKVLANDDQEPFDEKPYVAMKQETSETFSLNDKDHKQYVYKTEKEFINYTNESGSRFNTFRTFAIKIVFTLDRVAQSTFIGIPSVTDLKVIALDSVGSP